MVQIQDQDMLEYLLDLDWEKGRWVAGGYFMHLLKNGKIGDHHVT